MHRNSAAVGRYRNATCVQYGALESVMYCGCDAVSEQAGVVGSTEEAAVGAGTRCVHAAYLPPTYYDISYSPSCCVHPVCSFVSVTQQFILLQMFVTSARK